MLGEREGGRAVGGVAGDEIPRGHDLPVGSMQYCLPLSPKLDTETLSHLLPSSGGQGSEPQAVKPLADQRFLSSFLFFHFFFSLSFLFQREFKDQGAT